ncbi:MAG: hypothetical protein ACI837_003503 [Crocinitomicaceae bacterium]|jgi:hypothetical protein
MRRYLHLIPIIAALLILTSIEKPAELMRESTQGISIEHPFKCELETIYWMNSDSVTFVKLTIGRYSTDLDTSLRELDYSTGSFTTYKPPFSLYSFRNSCTIHAIISSNTTGYFLIDDFINIEDSVRLYVEAYTGSFDQGGAYQINVESITHISHIREKLDSLSGISKSQKFATKEWFINWKKNNPSYVDQRAKFSSKHKTECN